MPTDRSTVRRRGRCASPQASGSPWRTDPRRSGVWRDAVDHLAAADPRISGLIDRVGPCTLAPTGMARPFPALVETIVYQQLSGKAAATIYRRVEELFGGGLEPERLLGTPDDRLRSAGLSSPKILAIRDLARKVRDGTVPASRLSRLSDERLSSVLTSVRGIGPWSVQMILIFRLGRPDVWPISDLGIRKGATRVWGLPELAAPASLVELGRPLAPFRTVAAWYLWQSLAIDEAEWGRVIEEGTKSRRTARPRAGS